MRACRARCRRIDSKGSRGSFCRCDWEGSRAGPFHDREIAHTLRPFTALRFYGPAVMRAIASQSAVLLVVWLVVGRFGDDKPPPLLLLTTCGSSARAYIACLTLHAQTSERARAGEIDGGPSRNPAAAYIRITRCGLSAPCNPHGAEGGGRGLIAGAGSRPNTGRF
jgi:hypothetical protein